MKRFFLLIAMVALFSGTTLSAAPVSSQRALEIAKKIFAAQPATKAGAGDLKLIWDGEDVATKSSVQPAFYVFGSDRGGFVIIAGDDNARPVLAFSEDSPFAVEGMPDNVKWWMEQIRNYVRSAQSQTPEVARQWAALVATKASIDEALINQETKVMKSTVCWNQTDPANLLCPTINEEQSVCGCLPLAMSELLTYFGWPNQGVGSTDAYTYTPINSADEKTIDSENLADLVNFDDAAWTALKGLASASDFYNCTGGVRDNVSKLVHACGLLVKASFNPGSVGGTGASSTYVPAAFAEHMKYSKNCYLDRLSNHTISEWNNLLKEQVVQHPLLYCGYDSSLGGGHAYVLDGYAKTTSGEDVFHYNFGWGANCNGFYYSNYQSTTPTRPYVFDSMLEALFDFVPNQTEETDKYTYKLSMIEYSPFIGIQAGAPIHIGDDNRLVVGMMYNYTAARYYGYIKVKLENKDGDEKEVIGEESFLYNEDPEQDGIPSGMGAYRLLSSVEITKDLEFGDKIVVYYSDNNPASAAEGHYVQLTGALDGTVVWELPVMPAAFIKTAGSYHSGDLFQFQLMNHDYQYAGTKWTITNMDTGVVAGDKLPQSDREFKLTTAGHYKIEAAVAPKVNEAVVENLVTYITVGEAGD